MTRVGATTVLLALIAVGGYVLIVDSPERSSLVSFADPVADNPVSGEPEPIARSSPSQLAPTGAARQLAEIRLAADYRSAVQALNARTLDSDPLRVSAHEEVRSACALVHRPDAASPRVDLDPNRRPWLDQLQRRCAGLAAEALRPLPGSDPAVQVWSSQVPEAVAAAQGRDSARRQSVELLRSAVDVRLLYAALRYSLIEDQLPLREIFVGTRVPVRADIELALVNAADWIACVRSNSCGSDGLWTLYTCAQFGCPPGIDLSTAMRRNAPQWQFEISQAIARWVLGMQRQP